MTTAQRIARYIVEDGTQNSISGNWRVKSSELESIFNIKRKEITNMEYEIEKCLFHIPAVADVDSHKDDDNRWDWCFDVDFYLDYCPAYDGIDFDPYEPGCNYEQMIADMSTEEFWKEI